MKLSEGNEDVRQITRDEQQQEGKQGGRCEEQELAARQRAEQQEMERRNERGTTETGGLGERDGKIVQTSREEETTDGDRTDGRGEEIGAMCMALNTVQHADKILVSADVWT